jgi:hypothetical protein
MADLPYTICFRASTDLRDRLRELATREHRKLGDVVRILIEKMLDFEEAKRG